MPLLAKTIPNLINGVSQQPAEVRLPSQADEQINFMSSVVQGLKRRPGTRHIAKLLETPGSGAFVHIINRDRFEKYVVVILDGAIRVFDFQGKERAVKAPKGFNYLKAFSPSKSLRAVTVADYTFILNKERIARAYDPAAGLELVPVKQRVQTLRFLSIPAGPQLYPYSGGAWKTCGGRYSITVSGRTFTMGTAEGSAAAFASYVAAQLTTALGRACVASGTEVDIPLPAPENPFPATDSSAVGRLEYYDMARPYYRPGAEGRSADGRPVACEMDGFSILTSFVQEKIIGYASKNGDVIPAAEVTNKEGLVHVRLGDYGTTYKVLVDGVVQAAFTTSTTDRSTIGTDNIATQLYNQLVSKNLPNIGVSLRGSAILMRATNTTRDFTLTVEDSNGGKSLMACKGRIQVFTDLPAKGFEGFTIKVAGQDGVEADDYYTQYTEVNRDGEKTSGSWKEVAKKGLRTRPAPDTMPHRLISEGDGSFTFEPIAWDGRVAGDEDTAPEPSFINKAISDVFFFKNRLGLLADENVVFSEAGSYYNFYPTTVLQSLESSPIDVAVTNDKVSVLRHAVPFNETLLLFSDQTQFILRSGDRLTKETVNIDVTTRFEASLDAKPVGAGKNVFFGVRRGPWASVREYYVDPEAKVNDAADVAGHCPEYLAGSITQIAASSNEDMVLALTDSSPDTLYAYKYYWQGNEKVQSAWSKWKFGGVILGFTFIDSYVALALDRNGRTYLELLNLTADGQEEARGFKNELHLDRLTFVSQGAAAPWTEPDMVAVDQKGNLYSGDALQRVLPNGTAAKPLYLGKRYHSYYRFSPLVLANADTRVAPLVGRLMLRFMTLNYVDTGFFQVGVQVGTRPPQLYAYSGRRLGSPSNRLGQVPIDDGRYRFPILGEAQATSIWLESNSHLPCSFQSAEWEATYHRVSRPQ